MDLWASMCLKQLGKLLEFWELQKYIFLVAKLLITSVLALLEWINTYE